MNSRTKRSTIVFACVVYLAILLMVVGIFKSGILQREKITWSATQEVNTIIGSRNIVSLPSVETSPYVLFCFPIFFSMGWSIIFFHSFKMEEMRDIMIGLVSLLLGLFAVYSLKDISLLGSIIFLFICLFGIFLIVKTIKTLVK